MKNYIYLPGNVKINIFNLPENFKEIVKKTFREYTEGTREEYRYCDKLAYIDCFISKITKNNNEYRAVSELVKERFEYEWDEQSELLKEDDIYSSEFMERCYEAGRNSQRLYQCYGYDNRHIYEQIQKVVVKVITIVMNYEEESEEDND